MTIVAAFALRLGQLDLEVDLTAPAGSVTAVLGPNGSGKTTVLRSIAGSLAVDAGSITLAGEVLDRPPDVFVPQERRRVGVVHQDYVLFPHLTSLDNVAFGPRARGASRRDARALAATLLDRVGVGDHASSKPGALSGGQSQRVALARALATEPAALLLDEPLAALDASTRAELRRDLRHHLAGFAGPTILVTHDPVDALALADHVAILEAGRITQAGTLAEVTARPRSRYVADLIGTNLIHGTSAGGSIDSGTGLILTAAESHDGAVFATVAPAAIALHRAEPGGSPRNRWRATVDHLDLLGDRVRVHLAPPVGLVAEITAAAAAELALREGDPIWAAVKATEIHVYDR
ncbi:MAG: ABC transporter ATP-binding protein [Actinomycetota bacterium]|nr:ABC transporter ATP-binding protein [Actinomycetota bacterium]